MGGEGDYYTYHHQNDACIKMGIDESHFNVSLIVTDKVTRQCSEITIFEEQGEPKKIRIKVHLLTALPLGQTGSQNLTYGRFFLTQLLGNWILRYLQRDKVTHDRQLLLTSFPPPRTCQAGVIMCTVETLNPL